MVSVKLSSDACCRPSASESRVFFTSGSVAEEEDENSTAVVSTAASLSSELPRGQGRASCSSSGLTTAADVSCETKDRLGQLFALGIYFHLVFILLLLFVVTASY